MKSARSVAILNLDLRIASLSVGSHDFWLFSTPSVATHVL